MIISPAQPNTKTPTNPLELRSRGELRQSQRKQEILAKAAPGKIRIELVSATVSAAGRGEVDSMFVEEAFQARGIGSELVRRALAWMENKGASSKVVTIADANEGALAFCKRFGFHPRTILLQQTVAEL